MIDTFISIAWVYILGAVVTGLYFLMAVRSPRVRAQISSKLTPKDLQDVVLITAAIWPWYIAFMLYKMFFKRVG